MSSSDAALENPISPTAPTVYLVLKCRLKLVEILAFVCGFVGSMIGEIFAMDESFRKDEPLPRRFHKVGFWLVRVLLAGFGGGLAVLYKVENPIAALQIGASAPLIYRGLSKGYKA
jgi:hypothetical protein